jgi:glycosyltransferase involved in cell wall biosynthesis
MSGGGEAANSDRPGVEPVRIVWAWRAMGPYHRARMRALAALREIELTVVERFARDPERAWDGGGDAARPTAGYALLDWASASARSSAHDSLKRAEVIVLPGWAEVELLRWGRELALATGARLWVWSVSTERDRPRRWWREAAKRWRIARFDGALAAGVRARDYLARLGMQGDAVARTGNAADAAPFVSAGDRITCGTADGEGIGAFGTCAPHLLFAGRLIDAKNLDGLLMAMAALRRDLGDALPRLVVAGDGAERHRLEAMARELGLSVDTIEWHGETPPDRLAALMATARCLVLPSRSEPWGLVANEAMHARCPVVLTDVCGCVPELAAGRDHAFVAPTPTPGALATAIRAALDATADADGRRAVGLAAQRAAAEFAPERCADRTLAALIRQCR